MGRRRVGLAFTLVALWTVAAIVATASPSTASGPNVVVVVTDDQPIGTMQKMPHVLGLARRGMTFVHAFVSNPLCCPSRAAILTGLFSGHTGVWTNGDGSLRWGGWPAFRRNGRTIDGQLFAGTGNNEQRTLALYLRRAGYRTGLFGKYLNHYETTGGAPPVPPGWSSWHSFVGHNGKYYDYRASNNGAIRRYGHHPRDYSTDVFGHKAVAFLRSADIQSGTRPFFLYFAPYAPHGVITPRKGDSDVRAPRKFETPAFNERDVSDKPGYVRTTRRLTTHEHARMSVAWDHLYGALLDVDRWLGRFQRVLPRAVRRHTVFVFTSDNGWEWGDHRLRGKGVPYERAVRVPLVIAGPRVAHGTTGTFAANADLTPTILDLARLDGVGGPFDGRSLAPVLHGTGGFPGRNILLEHLSAYGVPSFCGVRAHGWMYAIYQNRFQELYNLEHDPSELRNVARARPAIRRRLRARALALCRPRPPGW